MLFNPKEENRLDRLIDEVRLVPALTPDLFSRVIAGACSRLPVLIKAGKSAVCTNNSDSEVLVMKSANQGMRHDASNPLNRARDRCIFGQGSVRPRGVVIASIIF
jgi:hypothetical protein